MHPYLSMIAHGTTGSDGIDAGVHLRWAFDDKLGFPDCFKLYRRRSDLNNRYAIPFHDIALTPDLPYAIGLEQNTRFIFQFVSATSDGMPLDELEISYFNADGNSYPGIALDGSLDISFSKPVRRIELGFGTTEASDFQIIVKSEDGPFYPHRVVGSAVETQYVAFDAPGAVGLRLDGQGIFIGQLVIWLCTVEGGEWVELKQDCGCGLPRNQLRSAFIDETYPAQTNTDLAIMLCRLGYASVEESPYSLQDFLDIHGMLMQTIPEGLVVPAGWALFQGESVAEPADPDENTPGKTETTVSKYDFLLMESLRVHFARLLDLYFVDTEADDDTYYDYNVTARWPAENKRRLDHEITFEAYEAGQTFFFTFPLNDDVSVAASAQPEIVEQPFPLARTTRGLQLRSRTPYILIDFVEPVTEVQLFLVNPLHASGSYISVEAYKNYLSASIDRDDLRQERGIVRLRGERIDSLRIYAPEIVISRLHYDRAPFPVGLQNYLVCGVMKRDHYPLTVPAGLIASFIPGGTRTDQNGDTTERPYLAGLRWEANEDADRSLISIAPLLYHVERKLPDETIEALTSDSPVFISPPSVAEDQRSIPEGWPEERQYYLSETNREDDLFYRIAAIDMFGRQSTFSEFATYVRSTAPPPPPEQVSAQFLDYSTYDPASGRFADSTIKEADREWLINNQQNAIVVRWKWPERRQLQAPDTEGFNIHFKAGWLNTYSGVIATEAINGRLAVSSLHLTATELAKYKVLDTTAAELDVFEFRARLNTGDSVPRNAFRLCWMRQGDRLYLVLKNTRGRRPALSVLELDGLGAPLLPPQQFGGFGISLTGDNSHFIDYGDAQHWDFLHDEPKNLILKPDPDNTGQPIYVEDYQVYLTDPSFPDPPFSPADRDKVRYAQIAVSSHLDSIEGSVSGPATIMAIYREKPQPLDLFRPVSRGEIAALKAGPANVYGKSAFYLRWPKANGVVKHQVFRALDDTLFTVDNQQRPGRSNSVYDDFKTAFPEFDPADVDVIAQLPHEADPVRVSQNYAGLTPGQLQILAGLADNQSAFSKMHEGNIDENDPGYADRVTEIPDPLTGATYVPDENSLLYCDESLDGRSANVYFYALKTVDTNGLAGKLSLATPPVQIPRTYPPSRPAITSISGGENRITIRWATDPGSVIAGYLLYRTQEKHDANDWRRMTLIKANASDEFSVTVEELLPAEGFEFADTGVLPRQAYYYGVVAIGLNDDGKQLRSRNSAARNSQAWDLTPPDPPVWDEAASGWVYVDADGNIYEWEDDISTAPDPQPAVRLIWMEDARISSLLVSRSSSTDGFAAVVANWISGEVAGTGKRMFLDRYASVIESYTYLGLAKSPADLRSTSQSAITINQP